MQPKSVFLCVKNAAWKDSKKEAVALTIEIVKRQPLF